MFKGNKNHRPAAEVLLRMLVPLFVVSCLCFVTACNSKQAPSPPKAARVSATTAFERYFGPAPTTDKGTCYAFVIYFPSAKEPGKVVPFPFFSYDEASLKKIALERHLTGMDEKAYAGQFLQPYPNGTRLSGITDQNGTVTADYSREIGTVVADRKTADALYNAVALTALQFKGVKGVRITSEGADLFPGRAVPVEAAVVMQPAAPRLLNVVAVKETPAGPITEVDALFDRPVDIRQCRFSTADGNPIAGDVYQAMFDMAAILKPKDAAALAAGANVKVNWQVTDKLGRSATGEGEFPLVVKTHQD